MQSDTTRTNKHGLGGILLTCFMVLFVGIVLWRMQDIQDYARLYNYTPPARVSTISETATFTKYGQKLFYVNKPAILEGSRFSAQCPIGAEKTVVLGCYKTNDNGIYLFDVTDSRLKGIVEVTAAHEMLHAAYMRLPTTERDKLDAQLTDYYQKSLKDTRIRDTIEAYKQSEPTALVNEMHSIFGTEIQDLPPALEEYYARYFKDRKKVVALLQHYQAEFLSRQQKIDTFDTRLKSLKSLIEDGQRQLETRGAELQSRRSELDRLRASGDGSAYNAAVDPYNNFVASYNALLRQIQGQIAEYNQLVEARNAVALEQRDLMDSMSADVVPKTP